MAEGEQRQRGKLSSQDSKAATEAGTEPISAGSQPRALPADPRVAVGIVFPGKVLTTHCLSQPRA